VVNILVVDDNLSLLRGLVSFLKQEGHSPVSASTVSQALKTLEKGRFDLVITDLKLPDGLGLEVVRAARQTDSAPEVILMTAFGSVETAVEAMKLGALDYLTKPVPIEEFAFRVSRVSRMREMSDTVETIRRSRDSLLEAVGYSSPLDGLVGGSTAMREVKTLIRKAAGFPSTVLITGETGTGKELAAFAIHSLSPWSDGPFVRVNCASIPETLYESELFGHEKGAFTDARERRIGRFEAARGGTLFLDEVGEIPVAMQAKLLRALQEKEITRVGGNSSIKIDARIVAATNRDLDKMAASGEFREDLLYRLAVVRIPILQRKKRGYPRLGWTYS
jgi:DNA-binding NtrC family response regulator